MKYGIIINDGSGSVTAQLKTELEAVLKASQLDYRLYYEVGDLILKRTNQLVTKVDVIVVGGGDGSLAGIAQIVADNDKVFGVLPLGTLNHFAKDLNIPFELEAAVRLLEQAKTKRIDFATVNAMPFLNNSSIGLYPQLVFRREASERKLGKWPAAALSFLQIALRPLPNFGVEIHTGDETIRLRTFFIFIGNNDYGADRFGMNIREKLDDGELDCIVFAGHSRASLAWHLVRLLIGRPKDERIRTLRATSIRINVAQAQVRVSHDGEASLLNTPLEYRIHHRALRVICA